jgi:hypothetical protein
MLIVLQNRAGVSIGRTRSQQVSGAGLKVRSELSKTFIDVKRTKSWLLHVSGAMCS